jgi:hypothetical protein
MGLVAVAGQHQKAAAMTLGGDVLAQPGLPHPWFAADHDQSALPPQGALQEARELSALRLTADKRCLPRGDRCIGS